eukprot:gene13122-17588_t
MTPNNNHAANSQSLLIQTGLSLGLLHVLAGPDHLSALAALSVGSSWKAFSLGFRWGLGHSSGLIVVAVIFISLKGELDLKRLGRYCDLLVGLFMVLLGCYGVVGAIRIYREKRNKRDSDLVPQLTAATISPLSLNKSLNKTDSSHSLECEQSTLDQIESESKQNNDFLLSEHHHDHHLTECQWCPLIDMKDPLTQRIMSFCIGLLHGVAGPGGILGVIPAVEMQNWKYSFLYLGSFIFSSTLSMGAFAAIYGELTKRIGATAESVELGLSLFSSALSIVVGTIWFVLSILGKLDKFFH